MLKVFVIGASTLVLGLRGCHLLLDMQLHCTLCLVSYGSYVTVATFLMSLLMNKFTGIVLNDLHLDEIHANF